MNKQWFPKIAVWLVVLMVLVTIFKHFEARQAEMDAEEHGADKDSVLGDLKAKKDEAAKQSPEKHAKDVVKKSRGGEAL